MDPEEILNNLGTSDDHVFKQTCQLIIRRSVKGIVEVSADWGVVKYKLLKLITENKIIGKETILLASYAYCSLLEDFEENVTNLPNNLEALLQSCNSLDAEMFKLTMAYGYLQINNNKNHSQETFSFLLDIVYPHCVQYTKYSYLAHKVLKHWILATSSNLNFWENCTLQLERRLETIIFCNWDNCIKDLAKCNVDIFNIYLNVMNCKYDGFVEMMFYKCVNDICWSHVIKYVILAEICKLWDNVRAMTELSFLQHLFNSLTFSHLRCASSTLYDTIARKLKDDKWIDTFVPLIETHLTKWDETENEETILTLLSRWIVPTILRREQRFKISMMSKLQKRTRVFIYVNRPGIFYDDEYLSQFENNYKYWMSSDYRKVQFLALVIMAMHRSRNLLRQDKMFKMAMFFFYSHANTESIYLRSEMLVLSRYFLCVILINQSCNVEYCDALYDFIANCFEIGSCYQRKVFGLGIYKSVLCYFTDKQFDNSLSEDRIFGKMKDNLMIRKLRDLLKEKTKKNYMDKRIFNRLLRLVLDPASNIRLMATDILIKYFDSNFLSMAEEKVLWNMAMNNCNSSKFFEIESGATLFKILNKLSTKKLSNKELWLLEAKYQLSRVKRDILAASIRNVPFYGMMTAILMNVFCDGPESQPVNEEYLTELLSLLEDAVQFFIQTLFTQFSCSESSSSFAEMGIAISEAIRSSEVFEEYNELILSPAHQNIINCIWRSLKVSTELAKEIALVSNSLDKRKRSGAIIINVLTKCRHKGAIEAAGIAIHDFCRYLCKNEVDIDLVEGYLRKLLTSEIWNINTTRRGAGLSIMFHKIVAADIRKGRPLLHFAVGSILDSLRKASPPASNCLPDNCDNHWAMNIHFLKNLVVDKQLLTEMTPYLEDICFVAFKCMESQVFTIRNASLQLLGALIPRLAGQYTGSTLDYGYGYSANHLITHYPRLCKYILKSFKELHSIEIFKKHSSVVSILSLLSKLSVVGCELVDHTTEMVIKYIKCHLQTLFSCPIAHIRLLAAKTFAAFTGKCEIERELINVTSIAASTNDVNTVHGCLLAFSSLKAKLIVNSGIKICENQVNRFWALRCHQLAACDRLICFVTEKLLLENAEFLHILGCFERISREPLLVEECGSLILPAKMYSFPGFQEFIDRLMRQCSTMELECNITISLIFFTAPYYGYGTGLVKCYQNSTVRSIKLTHTIISILQYVEDVWKRSVYKVFHPKVVVALAECTIFQHFIQYLREPRDNVRENEVNIFSCINDNCTILTESRIVRFYVHVFLKMIKDEDFSVHKFWNLVDVERQLVARFLYHAYVQGDWYNNQKVYFYTLLATQDHVPQVREYFDQYVLLFIGDHEYEGIYWINSYCCFDEQLRYNPIGVLKSQRVFKVLSKYLDFIQTEQIETSEYPYDESNVTAYCENVKFLNIFYLKLIHWMYIVSNESDEYSFNTQDFYITLVRDIKCSNGILNVADCLYKEMKFEDTNVESFLKVSCLQYIQQKKSVIEEVLKEYLTESEEQ